MTKVTFVTSVTLLLVPFYFVTMVTLSLWFVTFVHVFTWKTTKIFDRWSLRAVNLTSVKSVLSFVSLNGCSRVWWLRGDKLGDHCSPIIGRNRPLCVLRCCNHNRQPFVCQRTKVRRCWSCGEKIRTVRSIDWKFEHFVLGLYTRLSIYPLLCHGFFLFKKP